MMTFMRRAPSPSLQFLRAKFIYLELSNTSPSLGCPSLFGALQLKLFLCFTVITGVDTEEEHCTIENQNGFVILDPKPGALCSVNGNHVTTKTRLKQGKQQVSLSETCISLSLSLSLSLAKKILLDGFILLYSKHYIVASGTPLLSSGIQHQT